jgi:hypothetical protein
MRLFRLSSVDTPEKARSIMIGLDLILVSSNQQQHEIFFWNPLTNP